MRANCGGGLFARFKDWLANGRKGAIAINF